MEVKFVEILFKNLTESDKKNLTLPFICLHSGDSNGLPYFQYLIVDLNNSFEDQFIARFKEFEKAYEYVDFLINKKTFANN